MVRRSEGEWRCAWASGSAVAQRCCALSMRCTSSSLLVPRASGVIAPPWMAPAWASIDQARWIAPAAVSLSDSYSAGASLVRASK